MRTTTESFTTLINIIGKDNALKVAKYVDGGYIYVPKLDTVTREERDLSILTDYRKGSTYHQLHIKYRLTERQIRKIIQNVWGK